MTPAREGAAGATIGPSAEGAGTERGCLCLNVPARGAGVGAAGARAEPSLAKQPCAVLPQAGRSMVPARRVKTEYMKRYKEPKWESCGACYLELLRYRLSRRLLEQAHRPWLWDGWEQGSAGSGSGSGSGSLSPPGSASPPQQQQQEAAERSSPAEPPRGEGTCVRGMLNPPLPTDM